MKIELSYEETQVMIQCIHNLNFSGEHIRMVGLLMDKLIKHKELLEKKKPTDKEN